ncbi:MAG: Crp/Fnr family transcriptional regulator [Chloroflexi bacterium]|nr:Crp/Fnr family transcriptional regulator [Chloroflexota bacterium]
MTTATEYLHRVEIFRDLPMEYLESLFHGLRMRECRRHTILFTPDEPAERLFILKSGQVEIYRLTESGKRLVTRRIGPMGIFGEMSLAGQSMQGCFAEATADSLVCAATREDVFKLLTQKPHVAIRLLEAVGRRVQVLEDQLEAVVFSPVRVRLARFLLGNARPHGEIEGYTHADIGDSIGALRQTVTETLSEMQAQGLVEVGHRWIRLLDRAGLTELSGGGKQG